MNRAMAAVGDDLRRYGIKDPEIRKMIRQRLIAAGLRPPKPKRPPRNAPPPGFEPGPPRSGR
jgi:hypothetical protein